MNYTTSMFKKLLSTTIALLLFGATYAQKEIKLKYSKEVKLPKNSPGFFSANASFEYKDDIYFIAVKENMKVFTVLYYSSVTPYDEYIYLVKYNKTKDKITAVEKINTELENTMFNVISSWYKDGIVNIYSSYYNTSVKKKYVFCTAYNLETKKSKTSKIFEADKKDNIDLIQTELKDKMVYISMDKTKKKSAPVFNYCISDHDLNIIAEGNNIKLTDFKYEDIYDFSITKNNKLVVETSKRISGKNIFSKGRIENDIYIINNNKPELVEINAEKFHTVKKMFHDKEGNLQVTCMYNDGEVNGKNKIINFNGSYGAMDGILIAQIDGIKNGMLDVNYIPFSNIDLKNVGTEKEQIKNDKDFSNLSNITNIKIGSNGEKLVLAEKRMERVVTRTSTNSKTGVTTSNTTYYYDYGPGLIFNFDKDNVLLSTLKLNYKTTFANVDPGVGLNYFSGNNNTLIAMQNDKYYRLNLDDKVLNFRKVTASSRGGFFSKYKKALLHQYTLSFTTEDKVYIVDFNNIKAKIAKFDR